MGKIRLHASSPISHISILTKFPQVGTFQRSRMLPPSIYANRVSIFNPWVVQMVAIISRASPISGPNSRASSRQRLFRRIGCLSLLGRIWQETDQNQHFLKGVLVGSRRPTFSRILGVLSVLVGLPRLGQTVRVCFCFRGDKDCIYK